MLKQTFFQLLAPYTSDEHLMNAFWIEIERHYAAKNRHYHTLQHLGALLQQLLLVKNEIEDWETMLFSLYYHDIIYNALKSDNEARSADLAQQRMTQIGVAPSKIETCTQQILATKAHLLSTDSDTNFFTDADLSILGQPWETYIAYAQKVRKEYSIYPDFIYNPGRKKVLKHFLGMNPIFKTAFFYDRFEGQAKENLRKELNK